MATITGYTAARMKEIEDAAIVDGHVNVGGDLILHRFDGATINAGSVIGPQGVAGPPGPANHDLGYYESLVRFVGASGPLTLDVAVANHFRIAPTGAFSIVWANAPTGAAKIVNGTILITSSAFAVTWPAGTQFAGGAAPVLSGKTLLSFHMNTSEIFVATRLNGIA